MEEVKTFVMLIALFFNQTSSAPSKEKIKVQPCKGGMGDINGDKSTKLYSLSPGEIHLNMEVSHRTLCNRIKQVSRHLMIKRNL